MDIEKGKGGLAVPFNSAGIALRDRFLHRDSQRLPKAVIKTDVVKEIGRAHV